MITMTLKTETVYLAVAVFSDHSFIKILEAKLKNDTEKIEGVCEGNALMIGFKRKHGEKT